MNDSVLHVYFTEEDVPTTQENVLVITEDINNGRGDWQKRLSRLEIETESVFSYQVFWPHLVSENLINYLSLYKKLSTVIQQKGFNKVVTHDLERGYRLVAKDIAEDHSITVEHITSEKDHFFGYPRVFDLISILVFFVDSVYSLFKSQNRTGQDDVDKPLFFPYPGRYDSVLPVVKRFTAPPHMVVPSYTIGWELLGNKETWSGQHDPQTVFNYTNVWTILEQIKTVARMQMSLLTRNIDTAKRLNDTLGSEYGIQAERTVDYVCQKTLRSDIRSILTLPLINKAIKQKSPSDVVVGSLANPRDRAALITAKKQDIQTHVIPHSIINDTHPLPPGKETRLYLSGDADVRLLRSKYSASELPKLRPFGRPYLDNLADYDRLEESEQSKDIEVSRIVVGTQPFDNWIRRQFIQDVLRQVRKVEFDKEIIIKIHPSESKGYYRDILSEGTNVKIRQGPIDKYVNNKSLMITINSNVGIESIVLGGYCISYNPFSQFTGVSSYIDGDTVPHLTDTQGLESKLREVTHGQVNQTEQKAHIEQCISFGGSADRIATEIQSS